MNTTASRTSMPLLLGPGDDTTAFALMRGEVLLAHNIAERMVPVTTKLITAATVPVAMKPTTAAAIMPLSAVCGPLDTYGGRE